ncbi:hypothetical protein KM043_004504 [Ampulex compressa]|nr:hypothetical protein KM043_004504 [Ampulex compressa]
MCSKNCRPGNGGFLRKARKRRRPGLGSLGCAAAMTAVGYGGGVVEEERRGTTRSRKKAVESGSKNEPEDCHRGKDNADRAGRPEEGGCNNSARESLVVSSLVPYQRATMPF